MTGRTPAADDAAVADEAFASGRDRGGNDAPPVDDGHPPADGGHEPGSTTDEGQGQQPRYVPLAEHLEERKKFKEQLESLRTESAARTSALERELAELRGRVSATTPRPRAAPPPSFDEDPDAAVRHVTSQVQIQAESRFLNFSEVGARRHYGQETVDQAFEWATKNGNLARGAYLEKADPWGEMVEDFKRAKTLEEVGDPAAFRKKIEEEVRNQILADLKAGKLKPSDVQQQQQQRQQFPGTLADATRGGEGLPVTDEALAKEVFGSGRKRA
jgi:hypothetical protein